MTTFYIVTKIETTVSKVIVAGYEEDFKKMFLSYQEHDQEFPERLNPAYVQSFAAMIFEDELNEPIHS